MNFTYIFLCMSINDYTFCDRLKDDLRDILGENGQVFSIMQGGSSGSHDLYDESQDNLIPKLTLSSLEKKDAHKIFMVVLSPDAIASTWVNEEIEIVCRRKDDPEPAKRMTVVSVLYRPCQVPSSLERLQVVSLLPPKSYKAAFQELIATMDLPSQTVSQQPTMPASRQQQPPVISEGGHRLAVSFKLLTAGPDAIKVIRTFTEHIDKIFTIALSADGRILASGSRDMRINIWDPRTGELLQTLNGHTDTIRSIILSADGRTLVSVSEDKTARLWNVLTGQLLHTFTIPEFRYNYHKTFITLSADGLTLAVVEMNKWEQSIQLWDLRRGKLLHSLKSDPKCMALSADGLHLVCGNGRNIQIWNTRKGKLLRTLSGHTSTVESVALSADGRKLASGSEDKTIKLWNFQTGQILHTLSGHTDIVHSVSLSADGQTLVSSSHNEIQLWNTLTAQLLRTLKVEKVDIHTAVMNKVNRVTRPVRSHTKSIESVALSADGRALASGGQDGIIIVWGIIEEVAEEKEIDVMNRMDPAVFAKKLSLLHTLTGHSMAVTGIAISQDNRIIVSGSHDKTIKVWNAQHGILLHTISIPEDKAVLSIALSPDANTIASGQEYGHLKIWNAHDGTLVRTLKDTITADVRSVAFSPDGRTIASGARSITIWNASDGTLLRTLRGHKHNVIGIVFSQDSRIIVSGSSDKTIKVWNALDGTLLRTLDLTDEVNSIALSQDGRTLVSGQWDGSIMVWNVLDGSLLRTFKLHKHEGMNVAISPDGRIVVSGNDTLTLKIDKTITIWNPLNGTILGTLKGHTGSVSCVAFSQDGHTIISGGSVNDHTIKIWGIR